MNKIKSYLDAKNQRPFSREEADIFVQYTIEELNQREILTEEIAHKSGSVMSNLQKKLEWGSPQIKITTQLALFLCSISSNSNETAMWAYTLNRMYACNPKDVITLEDWTYAFPFGIPTEQEKSELWEAQKSHDKKETDLVNHFEFWQIEDSALQEVEK